jgi:hypothetical protein
MTTHEKMSKYGDARRSLQVEPRPYHNGMETNIESFGRAADIFSPVTAADFAGNTDMRREQGGQ